MKTGHNSPTLNLYIHIPFCKARCRYCGFFSTVGKQGLMPRYFATLKKEIEHQAKEIRNYSIKSIYIGGGTPSLIDPVLIEDMICFSIRVLNVSSKVEITLEANPESITEHKLATYKKAGVNRLSLGLQAWQNQHLFSLGRLYENQEFVNKYYQARSQGFDNINVDLIFGFPKQTLDDWKETLERVIDLRPNHISAYSLELEEKSYWGKLFNEGRLMLPDETIDRGMYHYAVKTLANAGYHRYEVSNFALKGKECRHNYDFWQYRPYIGIGAGAYSWFKDKRSSNIENVEEYINSIETGHIRKNEEIEVIVEQKRKEYLILGLRTRDGVNEKEYLHRFGHSIEVDFSTTFNKLEKAGLIERKQGHIRMTDKGIDGNDNVSREIVGS